MDNSFLDIHSSHAEYYTKSFGLKANSPEFWS